MEEPASYNFFVARLCFEAVHDRKSCKKWQNAAGPRHRPQIKVAKGSVPHPTGLGVDSVDSRGPR